MCLCGVTVCMCMWRDNDIMMGLGYQYVPVLIQRGKKVEKTKVSEKKQIEESVRSEDNHFQRE